MFASEIRAISQLRSSKRRKRVSQPTITLAETESLITRLSETRGIKNKTALLTAVLHHATPLEAKYLVKLLSGDLRIGLREGLVEDAIDLLLGASALGWIATVAYPVIRYLKPLPETGPGGQHT